jgi:5-(hydroxymethyl)furfural/furfural oxidase
VLARMLDTLTWRADRILFKAAGNPAELRDVLENRTALRELVFANVTGVFHPAGTCRMGEVNDPDAVVDAEGCVYGVEGLRVADASIMPTIPSANTNIPTIMIAEKIAASIVAAQRR